MNSCLHETCTLLTLYRHTLRTLLADTVVDTTLAQLLSFLLRATINLFNTAVEGTLILTLLSQRLRTFNHL